MEDNKIDFSVVLGASMHDMKNSLCMLLQSIDTISQSIEHTPQAQSEFAKIHYEVARVNSNLLQILALYRERNAQLPLNIEEHFLDDVIDELLANNELYITHKNIDVKCEVEEDLAWYFDADLISNLLNDILINALKYTTDKILISAQKIANRLVIEIQDNGVGYPESMLEKANNKMTSALLSQGRTGLGIYFANLIASAHINKEQKGSIQLANNSHLGGSRFTLILP
ncbi:sensor histidine kinase [Pseudoalteromonas sp.]|uniref:sensor histidine kinase n=1 Tax=Pseudoalteromonas sp. TaxID=53249 RepID=UPI00356ADF1A